PATLYIFTLSLHDALPILRCAFLDCEIPSRRMYLVIRLSLSYSATALLSGTLVALRALEREDLTVLHKWQNDEEIMRLARSFPEDRKSTRLNSSHVAISYA